MLLWDYDIIITKQLLSNYNLINNVYINNRTQVFFAIFYEIINRDMFNSKNTVNHPLAIKHISIYNFTYPYNHIHIYLLIHTRVLIRINIISILT